LYTYLSAIHCYIWNILGNILVLHIYLQIQNIPLHMHAVPILTQWDCEYLEDTGHIYPSVGGWYKNRLKHSWAHNNKIE
jgi:hypothetical protein